MANKIFLDANVILDVLLKRPGALHANQILRLATNGEYEAIITPLVMHLVYYAGCKFQSPSDVREFLAYLLFFIRVVDIPHEICLKALISSINDLEDAMLYQTAITHNADYFISSDKKLQRSALHYLFFRPKNS